MLRSGVLAVFKSATNLCHFFLPLRHAEMRKLIDPVNRYVPPEKRWDYAIFIA